MKLRTEILHIKMLPKEKAALRKMSEMKGYPMAMYMRRLMERDMRKNNVEYE